MKTNRKFGDSRIGVQSPYERTYHHQDINPSNHISINQSQSTSQRKNGNRSNAKIRSLHHPGTAPRVMSRAPMVHGQRPPPPSEPDAWCSLSAPTRPVRACRGHRAARPRAPPSPPPPAGNARAPAPTTARTPIDHRWRYAWDARACIAPRGGRSSFQCVARPRDCARPGRCFICCTSTLCGRAVVIDL